MTSPRLVRHLGAAGSLTERSRRFVAADNRPVSAASLTEVGIMSQYIVLTLLALGVARILSWVAYLAFLAWCIRRDGDTRSLPAVSQAVRAFRLVEWRTPPDG